MQDLLPNYNRLKKIRVRMNMTQQEFADMLGKTQGNVWFYEAKDQMMPPEVAKKLIKEAAIRGYVVTYEDIYGKVEVESGSVQVQA